MINKIHIVGNLGKDPECRTLSNGGIVAKFSVATTKTYKDAQGQKQKSVTWHNCECWGNLATVAEKYLRKGTQVYVSGEMVYDEYEGADGGKKVFPKVVAHTIKMLGGKPESSGPSF